MQWFLWYERATLPWEYTRSIWQWFLHTNLFFGQNSVDDLGCRIPVPGEHAWSREVPRHDTGLNEGGCWWCCQVGDPQRKGKTCLKVDRVRSQKGKKDNRMGRRWEVWAGRPRDRETIRGAGKDTNEWRRADKHLTPGHEAKMRKEKLNYFFSSFQVHRMCLYCLPWLGFKWFICTKIKTIVNSIVSDLQAWFKNHPTKTLHEVSFFKNSTGIPEFSQNWPTATVVLKLQVFDVGFDLQGLSLELSPSLPSLYLIILNFTLGRLR